MKIQTRIISAVILVVAVVNVVYALYVLNREKRAEMAQLRATMEENDTLLKVVTAGPLYDGNVEQLDAILDSIFANLDIVRIELTEHNGNIRMYRTRAPVMTRGELVTRRVVIARGIDELGEVQTTYSTSRIEQLFMASTRSLSLFALIMLLILAGVVYLVARGISGPIERLTESARDMANGHLDREISTSGAQELQSLGKSFVRMRDAIREKMTDLAAQNEALLRTQFSIDRAKEAIFWVRRDGCFVYVNQAACNSLGYTREELLSLVVFDIDPQYPRERWMAHWEETRKLGSSIIETTHRAKDGRIFPVELSIDFMSFAGEEYLCGFGRDITERKRAEEERVRLEAQLMQAQKMESVGRLAGGVAHDFNNMLSVILGYAELIKQGLPEEDPLLKDAEEIRKAAIRSRDITHQLLAFSKQQIISPKPVNLNHLAGDMQKSLARLIGEDIDIRFYPGEDLWTIRFDPSQIDQILINLAVNARDAMPGGGKLTIETANVHLDEAYCRDNAGFTPGDYVQLIVSDNGVGMDRETLAHVFEPFFTTKEVDKGTGLGLATVYGIVKQNNGFINIYSEPGQGTTFRIYFPRITAKECEITEKGGEAEVASGAGTILLVEDNEMVRSVATALLQSIGYTVLVERTPMEALSLLEKTDTPIDLLLTDVVMPGMKGTELRDRARLVRPGIKVLFMSGYTTNVIVHHGVLEEGVHFVQKPFSLESLSQKVREAMKG